MSYDKRALLQAKNHIDHFLAKASGINKPMEGFRQTGVIDQFKQNIRGGFNRQIAVISNQLKHLNDNTMYPDNMEALKPEQLSKMRQYIYHSTPGISKFVSNDAIFVKKKAAFEWGIGVQYQHWGVGNLKLKNTAKVLKKKGDMTFYRGESTGFGALFGNEGTDLLGNALYVAPSEMQARMFGDAVSKYTFGLKESDILQISTDDQLTKIIDLRFARFLYFRVHCL